MLLWRIGLSKAYMKMLHLYIIREKMFENDPVDQFEIAENNKKIKRQKREKIEQYEAGHPPLVTDSKAPVYC